MRGATTILGDGAQGIRRIVVVLMLLFQPLGVFAGDDEQAKLDQTMAPVALYPDSLLSQILMASTYPDQVAEAAKWSKGHADSKGDDAVKAVQDQPWDPSVASLVAFPQVLAMMGDKPDWVTDMGDAFLADPEKVMDTVQGLRKKAKEAGNLESSEQQKVVTDTSSEQTIIKIEPADPQIVYVPTYNPTIVYGTWWWPAYPPYYWPPPPGYGFAAGVVSGIGFGIGIAITNSIWGGFDWHHHDIDINVNRYNNINVNRKLEVNQNKVSWKHDSINRKGKSYADGANRDKFTQKLDGADKREAFRGRDADRQKAMDALKDKGIDPKQERKALAGSGGDKVRQQVGSVDRDRSGGGKLSSSSGARDGMKKASTRGSGNALSGVGSGSQSRLSADRGARSARSLGGGAGASGGMRGGGGGRIGGGGFGGRR